MKYSEKEAKFQNNRRKRMLTFIAKNQYIWKNNFQNFRVFATLADLYLPLVSGCNFKI